MPEEVRVRTFCPGDEARLNQAFNRVFGQSRPLEEWHWKFSRCPWGLCVALAEHASGQVLAQFAAIPTPFQVDGERVLVGQGVDAFRVDLGPAQPEPRELYRHTARFFFATFCQAGPLSLLYGLAGTRHAQVLTKHLGWSGCGAPEAWQTQPLFAPWPPRPYRWHVGFHSAWWDELWQRCGQRYQVAAVRDGTFVRWRYLEHPQKPYRFLFLLEGDLPVACAVLRLRGPVCHWVDLLWDGCEAALRWLSRGVKRLAAEWAASHVDLWLRGDAVAKKVLPSEGFQASSRWQEITLAVVSFEAKEEASEFGRRMYLTHGDGDLL